MGAGPGKRCSKCRALLPLAAYHRDASKRDGRRSACAECVNAAARKPGGHGPRRRVRPGAAAMPCTGPCGRVLPLGSFDANPEGQAGRSGRCKDCRRQAASRRAARTLARLAA